MISMIITGCAYDCVRVYGESMNMPSTWIFHIHPPKAFRVPGVSSQLCQGRALGTDVPSATMKIHNTPQFEPSPGVSLVPPQITAVQVRAIGLLAGQAFPKLVDQSIETIEDTQLFGKRNRRPETARNHVQILKLFPRNAGTVIILTEHPATHSW